MSRVTAAFVNGWLCLNAGEARLARKNIDPTPPKAKPEPEPAPAPASKPGIRV